MEASVVRPETSSEPLRESRRIGALLPTGLTLTAVVVGGVALAAASLADFGASGRALVGVVLCPVLLLLTAIDVKHRLLPNAVVLPAALLVALVVAAFDAGVFLAHLEAGLALFGFLFVFSLVSRGAIGMGDAKAGLLIGLALGSRTLSAMFAAFGFLFVAAVWALVRHGWSARKQSLPFGPFLALGAILAFFFA